VARQREDIARRYEAKRGRKRLHHGGGGGVRLGELRRLFSLRHLVADGVKLQQAIARVRAEYRYPEVGKIINALEPLVAWPPGELGRKIELRWLEQRKLGIQTLRCCDRDKEYLDEFWRRVKRRRDLKWQRKKRAKLAAQ